MRANQPFHYEQTAVQAKGNPAVFVWSANIHHPKWQVLENVATADIDDDNVRATRPTSRLDYRVGAGKISALCHVEFDVFAKSRVSIRPGICAWFEFGLGRMPLEGSDGVVRIVEPGCRRPVFLSWYPSQREGECAHRSKQRVCDRRPSRPYACHHLHVATRGARNVSNGSMRFGWLLCFSILALRAQLIPIGTPVPLTAKPPIIFLNGYEADCSGSQFSGTFGVFDQLFESTNRVSIFFDNCAYSGKPPIEELGSDFATFLRSLKYTDGTPVPQVDVVAHSMGGLIVRCYLSGKQTTSGVFQPPQNPAIRKMVFLAVPNFGSPIVSLLGFGLDEQANELANGTIFSFDLATWNQGTDDLRGVDALAAAGNGGTGLAIMPGFDDGVVSLSSASIGFAEPGRTRIIPYCHTGPGLITIAGLCPPNAPGIADAVAATDANAALVLSFLNDTNDWQTIGQAAEQNSILATGGGLEARAKSATDDYLTIDQASASKSLNVKAGAVAWSELLPAQPQNLVITTTTETLQESFTLPPAYTSAITVKDGPLIARVLPSAAAVFPLAVAPGEIVAMYGSNLGSSEVTAGGTALAIDYDGASQINAVVPDSVQGLVPFTVSNSAGSHTVNVLIEPAVPAIYTQDQSGAGAAAALNAVNDVLVTVSAPLHPGDYVSLYLTGLGAATAKNGLQYANLQPAVTVGGQPCVVSYAGRAPGFPGLDQINCEISASAAKSTAAEVVVTSGGRTSNTVTLAIE